MLRKSITYVDYNDQTRTEVFHFNLTMAEATMLEMSEAGGLSKNIEKLVATQDGKTISEIIRKVILLAYGEKDINGKRFIKSQELCDAFEQTEAYSVLFMSLLTDAKAAAEFVEGITPKEQPKQFPTN